MANVLVGVATYKRPAMLEDALRSVAMLDTAAVVSVLVVDNSPSGEGVAVVERLASDGYRFPITSQVVSELGISHARNAVVAAGMTPPCADFIAFLDDDQVAEPLWLDALLDMHRLTDAEAVGSAVYPKFESAPAQWLIDSKAFRRDTSTDGPVATLYGTGGLLVKTSALRSLRGVWFDPAFALTGGEDAEFLSRLKDKGNRFARAKRSIVHEVYPASRTTLGWVLRRSFRIGSNDMRLFLTARSSWGVVVMETLKVPAALLVSPFIIVASLGRPARQVDALCSISRALGKATALLGFRYEEYATPHSHCYPRGSGPRLTARSDDDR